MFSLLEATDMGPYAMAFHSLNLSEHHYKVAGEIDFLVVTTDVVLVIEVKGGRVARRQGIWLYTDRFGTEHKNSEGPFRQATSAMFSLRDRLVDRFGNTDLKQLPIDFVKIDGSFINQLAESPDDQVLVRALREVAAGFGKKTIAEYVEDKQTLDLLAQYGVDYAQGYYVGRPQLVSSLASAASSVRLG